MTDKNTTEVGGVELTKAEIEQAKKDGALEHVKESGKRDAATGLAYPAQSGKDLERLAETQRLQVDSSVPSTPLAPLLGLGLDELTRRLTDDKADDVIEFEQAKMLLNLERSGKNRTGYVKALLKAIGTDDPYKVTNAGPPYTNDETNVTDL